MRLPLVVCGGLLLLCGLGPTLDARSPAALTVVLTTDPRLTAAVRDVLTDEASRIWENTGVTLEWRLSATDRPDGRTSLRMYAIPRDTVRVEPGVTLLGQLIRMEGNRAIALMSVSEAERIVTREVAWRTQRQRDYHLGLVLGRAAAHEIGHYLLNMPGHAEQGLMRARFGEAELADPAAGSFDVDEIHRRWVRQRLADGLPLGPAGL